MARGDAEPGVEYVVLGGKTLRVSGLHGHPADDGSQRWQRRRQQRSQQKQLLQPVTHGGKGGGAGKGQPGKGSYKGDTRPKGGVYQPAASGSAKGSGKTSLAPAEAASKGKGGGKS